MLLSHVNAGGTARRPPMPKPHAGEYSPSPSRGPAREASLHPHRPSLPSDNTPPTPVILSEAKPGDLSSHKCPLSP